ncbi:MAG: efflux RND transporter periplasmic adaptor subunit [Bryobacterales bacterium]|nr:efflux RND transporter periplasmic adaptor subunit [Bryobacterales bacterium]
MKRFTRVVNFPRPSLPVLSRDLPSRDRKGAVLALAILALLAACAVKPDGPKHEPPKSAEAKPEPGEVRLSPELQKTAGLRIAEVERRNVPLLIRANGRLVADEEKTHKAGALVDGRVVKVFVNIGDRVQKGQVLARIHSHDIHESRSVFQKAKLELARLETQRSFAEKNRDRILRLLDLKAASQEQLDHAESEVKNMLAGIDTAHLEIQRARQHLEEFLEVSAEDHPEHKQGEFDHDDDTAPIKAPAAGVIISRSISSGSVAKPGDDLFVISDLSSIWMLAAIPEENMGRITAGMNAKVFIRAFNDRPFPGILTRTGDQLDPATRTVQARIVLANPQGELKPEMYATAELAAGGTGEAFYVPQESIQEMNGHSIVFVATRTNKFHARPVETGSRAGASIAIVSGLSAGDRVVTRGAFLLKSEMLKSTLTEE